MIGEGGSGGALALGLADVSLMQENASYSVIAPEGAAAILLHDATRSEEILPALKLRAHDLLELGVIDEGWGYDQLDKALAGADLVVICTPIQRILELVAEIGRSAATGARRTERGLRVRRIELARPRRNSHSAASSSSVRMSSAYAFPSNRYFASGIVK